MRVTSKHLHARAKFVFRGNYGTEKGQYFINHTLSGYMLVLLLEKGGEKNFINQRLTAQEMLVMLDTIDLCFHGDIKLGVK